MNPLERRSPKVICVSVDDADLLPHLLGHAVGLAVSIDTVDHDELIDAHLDAVTITDDGRGVLECRRIGEHCIPHGPTWTVPLDNVISLHVW